MRPLRLPGDRALPQCRLGQRGRIHQRDTDSLELRAAAVVDARYGVGRNDDPEVALAGFVDRGARAVGEVRPAEGERVHAEPAQVVLERGLEEGAPARLVQGPL